MEMGMLELDERLMAEFSAIDPIYVDCLAGVLNLGCNFASLFARFAPMIGMGEMVPAAVIIRPKASIVHCGNCMFSKMIEGLPVMGRNSLAH